MSVEWANAPTIFVVDDDAGIGKQFESFSKFMWIVKSFASCEDFLAARDPGRRCCDRCGLRNGRFALLARLKADK